MKKILLILLVLFLIFPLSASADLTLDKSIQKAIKQIDNENFEEAVQLLENIRKKHPNSSQAAYHLGITYKKMEYFVKAIPHLEAALTLPSPILIAYPAVIEIHYALDNLKKASAFIAQSEKEPEVKPATILFLKGLVFIKMKKYGQAIAVFQKAKEADSSLSQSADFQISLVYKKKNAPKKVNSYLLSVLDQDSSSTFSAFAREYKEALEEKKIISKVWNFSAGAFYQYDDNVVLKPTTGYSEVTGVNDHSSINTLSAEYKTLLSGSWRFTGRYNIYNIFHKTNSSHNMFNQTLSLAPGYTISKNRYITSPVSYSYFLLSGKNYMRKASIKPSFIIRFTPDHLGRISLGYGKQEVLSTASTGNNNRDAHLIIFTADYITRLFKKDGRFSAGYTFTNNMATGKNWIYLEHKITLKTVIPLHDRLKLALFGTFLLQDYKNVHTSYRKERLDKLHSEVVRLTWKVIKGLDLNIEYEYIAADSNISTYTYNRNIFTTGVIYQW